MTTLEVKKRPEKGEREEGLLKHHMVNIRVDDDEHVWLTTWADEISAATGYASSMSGALRLLLRAAMLDKPTIKAV